MPQMFHFFGNITISCAYLQPVLSVVPGLRCRKVLACGINSSVSKISRIIRVKNKFQLARDIGSDTIVGERLGWMEVENEQQVGPFKYNHFVAFVFPGNVCLKRCKLE